MSIKINACEDDQPVYVFDYLEVAAGKRQQVIDFFAANYIPAASERGLVHLNTWCMPAVELPFSGSHILIQWQYDNLSALWAARGVEENNQALKRFWSQLSEWIVSRTRRIGRLDQQVGEWEPAGAPPSANLPVSGNLQRIIVFIKPGSEMSVSTHLEWVNALEQQLSDSPVEYEQAGFNTGFYTGREGEVTLDAIVDRQQAGNGRQCSEFLNQQFKSLSGNAKVEDLLVLGDCVAWGEGGKSLAGGVKRTILLKARDDASQSAIECLESVLVTWAQQLAEISHWCLSRVHSSTGDVAWSHCFEQEFNDPAAILGSYLNHPYHWSVADRYFHTEAHEQVADMFAHTIRAVDQSVLRPLQRRLLEN